MRARKTNDEEILRLIREGKTQSEVAKTFGVSVVAIHKRLKRIMPPAPSLEGLTVKQRKFCELVAEGKSRTSAAMEAYDVSSRESAKALQSELMDNPKIEGSIKELMDFHGLTRSYRVKKLKSCVDHPDPNITLKALDQGWKLDGYPRPEVNITQSVDMNFHQFINGPQGRAAFLEMVIKDLRDGEPPKQKMMGWLGTCIEELEELRKLEKENYEKWQIEKESNPGLLLPYFDDYEELEKLRERKAQELASNLGITSEEAMAVILERNKQSRIKVLGEQAQPVIDVTPNFKG